MRFQTESRGLYSLESSAAKSARGRPRSSRGGRGLIGGHADAEVGDVARRAVAMIPLAAPLTKPTGAEKLAPVGGSCGFKLAEAV